MGEGSGTSYTVLLVTSYQEGYENDSDLKQIQQQHSLWDTTFDN
jgi:hypothetical protein